MRGPNNTLLSNASATGTGVNWQGGRGVFTVEATFGGGTVTLQFQTLNGTWVAVDGCALTAAGTKAFDLPPGPIRAAVATATAVYAYTHAL
ncbi:hypothetical protein [Caudoviricetes sp.]|nr:hypothetical protein [Caudoviricetes sp.]